MVPIDKEKIQTELVRFLNQDVYLHLETTTGAYAAQVVGAYIRNGLIRIERAVITGDGPYRVGLKMALGWVYAEGLTDGEVDEKARLLLVGHDSQRRLAVALELSHKPFDM